MVDQVNLDEEIKFEAERFHEPELLVANRQSQRYQDMTDDMKKWFLPSGVIASLDIAAQIALLGLGAQKDNNKKVVKNDEVWLKEVSHQSEIEFVLDKRQSSQFIMTLLPGAIEQMKVFTNLYNDNKTGYAASVAGIYSSCQANKKALRYLIGTHLNKTGRGWKTGHQYPTALYKIKDTNEMLIPIPANLATQNTMLSMMHFGSKDGVQLAKALTTFVRIRYILKQYAAGRAEVNIETLSQMVKSENIDFVEILIPKITEAGTKRPQSVVNENDEWSKVLINLFSLNPKMEVVDSWKAAYNACQRIKRGN